VRDGSRSQIGASPTIVTSDAANAVRDPAATQSHVARSSLRRAFHRRAPAGVDWPRWSLCAGLAAARMGSGALASGLADRVQVPRQILFDARLTPDAVVVENNTIARDIERELAATLRQ
jgi:hypothetical protein